VKPKTPCEDCIRAKLTRRSFKQSESHASRKGELIHSDIVELEVRSTYGDYKYFITFIDDFSRYITVFMLQRKAQAFESFVAFDAKFHNVTGRHVTTLRSDGKSNPKGTEYHSKRMKEYCTQYGIHEESSCAYTPEENSRAERPN
jgi:hypothetical protein